MCSKCRLNNHLTSSHILTSHPPKSLPNAPSPNPILSLFTYINLSDVRVPPRLAALIQLRYLPLYKP